MKDINKIVSDTIRKFRLEKKITQEKLALESGLHRAYIALAGDFMLVDLLIAKNDFMKDILNNAVHVDFSFGKLKVITKENLIKMKSKAGRPQDLADIDKLRNDNES